MKHNWEYKRLAHLCDSLVDGDWIESKDQSNNGIRLIQTGNIGNGVFLDKSERSKFVSEETFLKLGCTEIFEGDILVSRLPDPIGRACILPNLTSRTITAVDVAILRPNQTILPKFVVHYTKSRAYGDCIDVFTKGSTRKRVSRSNLGMIEFPVPPMEVQEQIVAELDKINEVIEDSRELLRNLDALAQSLFYDFFGDPVDNPKGWCMDYWGNLFDTILGKMLDKKKQNENDELLPYLANQNVQWGKFDFSTLKKMTFTKKEIAKFSLKKGDLLICEGGEAGRCAVWTEDKEILFQKALHRARPIEPLRVNTVYVRFCLERLKKNDALKNFITKATIEHLTGEKLKRISIPVPPLSLQEQFAARIEQIEAQKRNVEETIATMQTLLDSRMDYWFN